jgi:hypothetical protein
MIKTADEKSLAAADRRQHCLSYRKINSPLTPKVMNRNQHARDRNEVTLVSEQRDNQDKRQRQQPHHWKKNKPPHDPD